MRWTLVACAAMALSCLTGCSPEVPDVPPPPATTTAAHDIVTNAQARQIVNDIMAYAGTNRVINVEIMHDRVRLSVVRGQSAITYAWQDAVISQVDSDTAYVGQEIFDPRDVNIDNVESLFTQAADFSGSAVNQKLQIVDYGQGTVYMTVTTNPESTPVFFTTSALMVPRIDPANLFDLTRALRDVTSSSAVARIGVSSSGSVYADVLAGQGEVSRSLRNLQFPVQVQVRPEPTTLAEFDPSLVSPQAILDAVRLAATSLNMSTGQGFDLTVERHPGESSPSMTITMGTKTVHATLDGRIMPS